MDASLAHIVAEEYKNNVEQISRSEFWPEKKLTYEKLLADYAVKELIKDFNEISKMYSEDNELYTYNHSNLSKKDIAYDTKLLYKSLFQYFLDGLAMLINVNHKHKPIYKDFNSEVYLGVVSRWMFFAYTDEPLYIKRIKKEKTGEAKSHINFGFAYNDAINYEKQINLEKDNISVDSNIKYVPVEQYAVINPRGHRIISGWKKYYNSIIL